MPLSALLARHLARHLLAIALTVALVTVTLVSSGCDIIKAGRLDGTSWVLQRWSESSLDPAEFRITASFEDKTLTGQSAVNSYSTSYFESRDGKLATGGITSTLMAGPEPAMRAEKIYFELLRQVDAFSINNTTLTLLDANGNELLIFTKQP